VAADPAPARPQVIPRQRRNDPPAVARPTSVQVGDRGGSGSIVAVLKDGRLVVTVAHIGGFGIDISEGDARELYHGLGRILGLE
jgi:hypothetical protein